MESKNKEELIERAGYRKSVVEIMRSIHEQCVENEVFELLTQWMIEDRYNKMKRIGETEATIRAINKIAKENKNAKNAIIGIISLSGGDNK